MTTTSADLKRPELRPLEATALREQVPGSLNLAPVLDMQMALSMEIGRVRIPIRQLLGLTAGSVVELGSAVDEPFSVFINGRMIAQGEVVVANGRLGARFTDVVTEVQRAKALE